ncbi:MAG: hypothetical protein IT245_06170 [Bacteroidia bacterium]|nr:hypothetical protein [Bacteroidia bacterium]
MFGGELGLQYAIPLKKGAWINIQPYYTINSGFKQVQSFYSDRFTYFGLRSSWMIQL